jgi:hypothetical protein
VGFRDNAKDLRKQNKTEVCGAFRAQALHSLIFSICDRRSSLFCRSAATCGGVALSAREIMLQLDGGGGADFGGKAFGVEQEAAEEILVRFQKLPRRQKQNQQLQLWRAHCVSLRMNQSLNMKYLRRALHCGCLRPQLRAARTSSAPRLEQRRRVRQESSRLFAP